MKDNKRYFKNLTILVIVLSLISCSAFASDKAQNMSMTLKVTGPKLSPSGDEIVFDFIWRRNDKGGADIGVLSLKNDEIKIITKSVEGSINEYSTWSKDSKHILFRSSKEDGVRLLSINPETLKEDVLVFLHYNENYENKKYIDSYLYPIWFPLRDEIVFIKSGFGRDTILYSGYVYNLKKKKEKEIVKGMSDSVIFRHTWSVSYNGNYVFYTKKDDEYNDIWMSDLYRDHSGEQRLTKGYDVTYLRASPVKDEILFVARGKDKSVWTLYKLNIKTRVPKKLFTGNNIYLGFPSWSQDGSLIVFVNDKNLINIMDADKRKITVELRINMETITFPLLVKNRKVIFYHKYSSIWSVDMEGKNLKRIFPTDLKRELKELKGVSLSE